MSSQTMSSVVSSSLPSIDDSLVISSLGTGITRGCMDLGRLYQGKYLPPDRNSIHDTAECVEEGTSEETSENHSVNTQIELD